MTQQTQNGNGAGVLYRDSKLGNLWNSITAAGVGALIAWLSNLDFTSGPAWFVTLGPPAVGLVVGWLTSKALPRFKRH